MKSKAQCGLPAGRPNLLGARWDREGANVAVFAENEIAV